MISALAKRVLLLLVILACAVALGLWAYLETGRIETTENAYVKSHIINISPEVAGTIVRVAVEENQRVEQGALLLTLDARPYKLALQGAAARLDEVETDIAADKQAYLSALSEIDLHKSTVAYARSQLVRQQTLFDRALAFRESKTRSVDTWDEFVDCFKDGESHFVWAHWDGTTETELAIKDATKATIRCLPWEGDGPGPEDGECIKTGKPSKQRALFAKAY